MAILEVISGAALGSSVQVLFDGLVSLGLNCMQMGGIDAHLDNLKTKLQVIYWHLDDADNRQIYGEQEVKSWLEDVRDLAYDLEHLLDEFAREADKQEQRAESSTSGGLRKTKWLSFPSDLLSNVNMRSKIQDIDCKVENILTRKDHLCLKKTAGDGSTSNQDAKRLPSTSLKEPCFVGREKEANEIIQLLKTDVGHPIPTVISIVGIGGMGKTALAQQVYNDPQVTGHFEVKAWTCVSDVFNVPGITRAILQSVTSMNCEGKDLNWLQVKLEKNLSGKKFLIVLDDVWNEKPTEWTALLKPFESGAEGSKVLLTTRSLKVASIPKASVHRLQKLHDDDCTVLFAYHALGVKKFNDHPRLEVIGKKIVGKCGGLPLAAKTLGGLLRTTIETSEWEAILNSKLWDLPEERSEILPALKLSYVHLPFVLKRCFVYCAIFPKDYEIKRDKLIHWWMAEGLLGENDIENKWRTGLSYFNELVSRSFFQEGEESRYLMHDLIHDLAKSITGATCFNGRELELETYERNASLARARHASFVCTSFVTSEKLKIYHEMKKLRSFVMLKMLPMYTYLPQKALHDLVSELKDVRVFSMSHSSITEIPDSISQLKHLRHLDVSYTCIHTLPKSIGSISDLEALVLEGCQQLLELPLEIEKLTKLQYLDIRDTPKLRAMPSNLPNLIMVPRFVVGKEKGSRLKMLRHMHLEGKLFISELQRVEEVEDASNAKLYEKQGIDELVLQWAQDFNGSRDEEHETAVLDILQPHENLKILEISYYGGTKLPSWLRLYTNIMRIALCGCHNVTSLPSLGQLPSLEELHLEGLDLVTKLGSEFYGIEKPFPSLRTLVFDKMFAWEDWSHCDGVCEVKAPFHRLQHLIIRDCPKLLRRLPRGLDSLTKLEIDSCPCLKESPHVISLPSLQKLYLKNCNVEILNSVVDLKSLSTLEISSILELTCFESGFAKSLAKLEELKIKSCEKLSYLWQNSDEVQYLTSLKSLSISWCPRLASLMAMPPCLLDLHIGECDSLPPSEFGSGRFPATLKSLQIEKCQGVESATQIFGMEHQWIKKISIRRCSNLRSLEMDRFSHLKELHIVDCGTLDVEWFPPLPITMSHFTLVNCANIKYLPNNLGQLMSLQTLDIFGCKNIRCFPEGGLPPNLKNLFIYFCGALEVECFPLLPITISYFWLCYCPNIKCLPNNLHQLISLVILYISECENIGCFPEGGLPPNLQDFKILGCKNMKTPIREWGLHRLTSLKDLLIDGSIKGMGEKPCFVAPANDDDEDDAWGFLPSSLTELEICNMREGERLSSGLRNHLRSLQQLTISCCPKLRYFPGDGLPPSLENLHIRKCEGLEEGFSKPNGDYCHLLHEIPCVKINGKDRN